MSAAQGNGFHLGARRNQLFEFQPLSKQDDGDDGKTRLIFDLITEQKINELNANFKL